MQARPMPSCGVSVSVCLSVHLSVTFVHSVKTNNVSAFFSPSGNHIILVFLYQTSWQYSDGTPNHLTGMLNAEMAILSIWLHRVQLRLAT